MSKLKNYAFAITVISLILAFPGTMHGSTFICASGDVGCLVAAINQSNGNGQNNIINLSPGTYALPPFVGNPACLPIITGTVTIHGFSPQTTVITCIGYMFFVSSSGDLTLHGVTLSGAGISNSGGIVNLLRSAIRQGFADSGGAVRMDSGVVNIKNSVLEDNNAVLGGAFYIGAGIANIDRSRFTNNGAGLEGGAIWINSGILSISRSTFDHNSADFGGTMVVGNIFSSSTPPQQTQVVVNDSSFTDNFAFQMGLGGAGIVIRSFFVSSSVIVNNSTFARNSVGLSTSPGGIALVNLGFGTLVLNNSIVVDNVDPFGRRVGAVVGATVIQNTIIARNTQDCGRDNRSAGNNLIGNPANCQITLRPTDIVGDPGLGQFVDDGSPGNGHYPLLSNSPAIGAANNAACPPEDQIGQKRQGGCDIGAIEFRHKKDGGRDEPDDIIPLITKRE